jgi:hypothetical protein
VEPEPISSTTIIQSSPRRIKRRPLAGYALATVGYILMVSIFGVLCVVIWYGGAQLLTVLLPLYAVFFWLFKIGRRFLLRPAAETVTRDPRPYVLYLRAFDADVTASNIPEHGSQVPWWRATGLMAIRMISPRLLFAPPLTEEEQIVRAFRDRGPVIAVGTPDEKTPPLGASRVYLDTDDWKSHVTELVRDAGTVVIRISEVASAAPDDFLGVGAGSEITQGLKWEVATAPLMVPPDRLFLLVGAREQGYGRFWSLTHDAFPRGLPPGCASNVRAGRLRGLVGFEADWEPRMFPFSGTDTSFFRFARYPVTTAVRESLRALREKRSPRSARPSWWAGVLAFSCLMATLVFGKLALSVAPFIPPAFVALVSRSTPAALVVPAQQVMAAVPPSTAMAPLPGVRLVPLFLSQVRATEAVPVRVEIDPQGMVRDVNAKASQPIVAASVQNKVRSWRFQPIMRKGVAVPAVTEFLYPVGPLLPIEEVVAVIPPSRTPVALSKARLPGLYLRPVRPTSASVFVALDERGQIQDLKVQSGDREAAAQIEKTIRTWKFQPVVRNGVAIGAATNFVYRVRIK